MHLVILYCTTMKIFNKTWIAILALATAAVAACTVTKRNSENADAEKPADNDNLGEKDDNFAMPNDSINARRAELQERLEKLRATIRDREMSCVYGSPEVLQEYSAHTRELRHEADSMQNLLINMLESEKQSLNERLESIDETIRGRSGAKVYGSPEMIKKYNARNKDLQEKRASIQNEIDKIDFEINNLRNNK